MYDLLAKEYDGRYLGEKFQAENRQVFEWIREGRGGKIGAPRVLDLGAGTGLTLDIGVLDDGDFQDYVAVDPSAGIDRKSTRLNSSHVAISYAVFCVKQKTHGKSSAR